MNQDPERPTGGEHQHQHQHEHEPQDRPRIYVASLSDYNAGRLHGTWLDASADVDTLTASIEDMLALSPDPGAEEYAIHDYEGFGPLRISEYESLSTIARIARGIAEHGPAFTHWASITGTDPDELDGFEDAYLGRWDSAQAYAESLLDELGIDQMIEKSIPESLQPYVTVDVDGFARDLELSGDVTTSEGDGGVYLFART